MRPLVLAAALVLVAVPAAAQRRDTVAVPRVPAREDAAATRAAAPDSAGPRSPTPGDYNCMRTVWAGHPGGSFRFQSQGYLSLRADGSYAFSASRMVGRWQVGPAPRTLTFTGGWFADKGPFDATFGAEGAPHVDLHFRERGGDTHWVCAAVATRAPAATAPAPAVRPPARP